MSQVNSIVCFQKYLGPDYIYQTVSYNLWNIFATLQWIIKGKAVVKDTLCCLEAFYFEGYLSKLWEIVEDKEESGVL